MCRLLFFLITAFTVPGCAEDDLKRPPSKDDIEGVGIDSASYAPDLGEMVVYEVNMRAFSAQGNFSGVVARLENIEEMGANVIWLMPIHPIGEVNGVNSPYSVRDYEAVSSEYGSMDDLNHLINEAHKRDIAVIIDWVANHTAWDHDWISEHPEWYTQDSNGNIIAPAGTGWADVADLNYENNAMRQEMIESMKFWLENTGIDGFRLDAVDWVPMDFWSEAIPILKNASEKEIILLAEGGDPDNFSAGFEINYSWDFQTAIKRVFSLGNSAQSIVNTHNSEYSVLPDGAEKLRYITNHDIYAWDETVLEIFGLEGSVAAFVITAYLEGVPLIYTGQEIGHPSNISFFNSDPLDWSLNPEIYQAYKTVMQTRAELPPVLGGELETYFDANVAAFKRVSGSQEVLVLVNVRDSNQTYSFPEALNGTSWKNELTQETITLEGEITLAPYQYMILSSGI